MTVWFVEAEELAEEHGVHIFAMPREKWTEEANATKNHFLAVCFGTEEEALDWCYEYSTDHMKWSPFPLDFETEYLH
jgi:hypothetical protein